MAIANDDEEPRTYEVGSSHPAPFQGGNTTTQVISIGTGLAAAAMLTLGFCGSSGFAGLGLLLLLGSVTLQAVTLFQGLNRRVAPISAMSAATSKKTPIKAGDTHTVYLAADSWVNFYDDAGIVFLAGSGVVGIDNATVRLVKSNPLGGGGAPIYSAVVHPPS